MGDTKEKGGMRVYNRDFVSGSRGASPSRGPPQAGDLEGDFTE